MNVRNSSAVQTSFLFRKKQFVMPFFALVPQEFFHDPVTHTVGDPSRRPEIRTATIEYLAPAEYAVSSFYTGAHAM
jgi:hypothetical protein